MGFSKRQQGIYRGLVEKAWRRHAQENRLDANDRLAKEHFYRATLHAELGVWTTKELSSSKHFATACAAFEAIVGDSVYWGLKAHNESARAMIYAVNRLCQEYDLDESYARGIARQALALETLPLLEQMEPAQLVTVLRALRIHVRRMAHASDNDVPDEVMTGTGGADGDNDDPF